jgi:hypothetical protein
VVQDQTPKTIAAQQYSASNREKSNESGKRENDAGSKTESKAVEEKVEIKPTENKMAHESARALFGKRVLKEDSYLHTEENIKSTKKWWFKKGTVVDVRAPGSEGWWRVTDSELRGGWIRAEQLEELK